MVRETNGLLIYLLREYRHQMGNKIIGEENKDIIETRRDLTDNRL